MDDKLMTEEYARISILLGLFAGAWDSHLGGIYFITKFRQDQFNFSWEYVENAKREAVQMGVPEALTAVPERVKAMLADPLMMKTAFEDQQDMDDEIKKHGKRIRPFATPIPAAKAVLDFYLKDDDGKAN